MLTQSPEDSKIQGQTATKSSPRFSVVIPLYNKRLYIARAVESVLAQTFTDFELFVVDDGSTDEGVNVLSEITDIRLVIIRQNNQGVGPARNTGMRLAQGKLIAFLDADDAWFPNHLTELWGLSEAFPNACLLATSFLESRKNSSPIQPSPNKHFARQIDYFKEAATRISIVWTSAAAIRQNVFATLGGFGNARPGQDLEYWAKVALSYPVAVADRITAVYFRGTGGVMETLEQTAIMYKPVKLPLTLREVSPSVAMLCDQIEQNPVLAKNDSIHDYINGRLTHGVPGAIYRGDFAQARHVFTLAIPPLTLRQHFYRFVVGLPDYILEMISSRYRQFKTFKQLIADRLGGATRQ
jgi:hypothetical protein